MAGSGTGKEGIRYCEPAQFVGTGIPLTGDLTLELRDTSASWTVAAQGALRTAGALWDQPPNGAMVAGQRAAIRLEPTFGTITYAIVSFLPTGASTSSFFVEYPGGLSPSAGTLSFSVAATARHGERRPARLRLERRSGEPMRRVPARAWSRPASMERWPPASAVPERTGTLTE